MINQVIKIVKGTTHILPDNVKTRITYTGKKLGF